MKIPPLNPRRLARIEIIPLIDIVFFLLATFVMVSLSMIKNQAIPVNLPAAAASAPQERKVSAALSVTEDGLIYLDKERMTLEELAARLRKLKRAEPDIKIFIHGDEKASFGSAIQILDEVRRQGIMKVAIQTAGKPDEKKGSGK